VSQLSPYESLPTECLGQDNERIVTFTRSKPHLGDICPLLPEGPKLLDSNLSLLVSAMVYIGKAPTMGGVTDGADVHTVHEQRCQEDKRVGGEFDQQVKSTPIETVARSKNIQRLRNSEHTSDIW
jgi:hypothetical protein